MLKFIKWFSFVLMLALPGGSAGAWSIPSPGEGGAEVPGVPPPAVSSGTAVSSFTPVAIPDFAFSGQADIEAIIESAVRASTSSVEVAIYGFTLPRVADALVDAKNRGVAVRVIMNASHVFTSRRDEQIQQLMDNGVDMRVLRGAGNYGIMHNKIGIFDGKLVMGGSFNWAVTANTANSENAVFSREPAVIAGYRNYFDWMWGLSRSVADGMGEPVADYGQPPADPARPIMFNGALLPGYSFSPGGSTEANIINAVRFARESADIAVFSFYSVEIASAVIDASKRGVKVRVVVDRVQASQSEVGQMLLDNGIPFRWSQGFAGKGVMHNKFVALDGKLLMTGSFNWSTNAQENNFENMFYTMSPAYTVPFAEQFGKIFGAAYAPTAEDLRRAAAETRGAAADAELY